MTDEHRSGAEEFAAKAIAGDGVLGNYLVIAEMVKEDGVSLNFAVADGMPPWTIIGMLQSVMSMVDVASFDYLEDFGEDET